MKNPLLSLFVILLVTTLLSSSCALHAGELLGRWEADGVIGLCTGQVEGLLERAKSLGTAPYVIAAVVLTVVNLPVALCGMFLTPLRMIEMAIPPSVTFLPYVEIALTLIVFWIVMRVNEPFSGNHRARAELRDIEAQLRQHRSERQKACEIVKLIRETEADLKEMEAVLEVEAERFMREEVDRRFYQMLDDLLSQ